MTPQDPLDNARSCRGARYAGRATKPSGSTNTQPSPGRRSTLAAAASPCTTTQRSGSYAAERRSAHRSASSTIPDGPNVATNSASAAALSVGEAPLGGTRPRQREKAGEHRQLPLRRQSGAAQRAAQRLEQSGIAGRIVSEHPDVPAPVRRAQCADLAGEVDGWHRYRDLVTAGSPVAVVARATYDEVPPGSRSPTLIAHSRSSAAMVRATWAVQPGPNLASAISPTPGPYGRGQRNSCLCSDARCLRSSSTRSYAADTPARNAATSRRPRRMTVSA